MLWDLFISSTTKAYDLMLSAILDSLPAWIVKNGSPEGGESQLVWGKSVEQILGIRCLNFSFTYMKHVFCIGW